VTKFAQLYYDSPLREDSDQRDHGQHGEESFPHPGDEGRQGCTERAQRMNLKDPKHRLTA